MNVSLFASAVARVPVTVALTAVVTAVFGVELALGATEDFGLLVRLGALHVGRVVEHGEVWRLVTAQFLHAGWVHFVLNTLALVQLAALVELLFGSHRLLAFYLASGLVANLVSALFGPPEIGVGQVGASGALFGLVGLLLGVALYGRPEWRLRLAPLLRSLALTLAFAMTLLVAQVGLGLPILVDHWSHGGGLAFGMLLSAAYPEPMTRTAPAERGLAVGAGAVAFAAFAACAAWGERALDDLPRDVVAAFTVRMDAADAGIARAALLLAARPAFAEAGVSDPDAEFRALLDRADPSSLARYLGSIPFGEGQDQAILWGFERWVEIEPEPVALNGLAWTLLVHEDPAQRDPTRALGLVDRALADLAAAPTETPEPWSREALVAWAEPEPEVVRAQSRSMFLDTRAEALAQLGRMDEALADQREAVRLGAESSSPAQAEMESRLAALEARVPAPP